MPTRRVYRSRRRTARRYKRRAPPTSGGYLATAGRALSLATKVASLVNAEKFHFDSAIATTAITTAGAVFPLQLIPEGDDTQTRTGRSLKLAGLLCKMQINAGTSATLPTYVRLIHFIDWWSQGVVPAVGDLLVSASTVSFRNVDTVSSKRFKVLHDHVYTINVPTGSDIGTRFISKFHNVKHHLKFINTTGVQTATGSGQMYMLILASQVATNACDFQFNARSWYYDN